MCGRNCFGGKIVPRLNDSERKNLSNNLLMLSEKAHLTIPQMAKLCDIPLRTFQSYFYYKNSKSPSVNNLKKIANGFHTTPTALISSDYFQTTIEENRIYHNICEIRDELLDETPYAIIEGYLTKKYSKHTAFVSFCKNLDIYIEYVPIFSSKEITDISHSDLSEISLLELKKYMKNKQLEKLDRLESEQFIKDRLQKEGITEENAAKKVKQYHRLAQDIISMMRKNIPSDSEKEYGLLYIAERISFGIYDKIEASKLPIRIEVHKITNSFDTQNTCISNYVLPIKTYSIEEFMKIQDKFTTEIDELFL